MTKIERAAIFAMEAHDGQFRKGTGKPYIVHPSRVAAMVRGYLDAYDEAIAVDVVCAAWLHDTVEDTDITPSDLLAHFGSAVEYFVEKLTQMPPTPGYNRAQRKAMDNEKLKAAPDVVKIVKLCDRLDNTSDEGSWMKEGFKKKYKRETFDLLRALEDADKWGLVEQIKENIKDW